MSELRRLTLRLVDLGLTGFDEPKTPIELAEESLNNSEEIGLTPADAIIVSAELEGDDIVIVADIDPKKWLRQCFELDMDLYEVLTELQKQLSKDEIKKLVEWLQTDDTLSVAHINTDIEGNLSIDKFPKQFEI